jgi:hypothetical protein
MNHLRCGAFNQFGKCFIIQAPRALVREMLT